MYKNNKLKKYISALLSIGMIAASLTVGAIAYGDDLIPINSNYFPDATWQAAVSDYLDTNGDGYLSATERARKSITVSAYIEEEDVIEDLKGIEYFNKLERLGCRGVGLKKLDVSALTELTQLTCGGNELESLDVTKNTKLTKLDCSSNEIKALNVTNNRALDTLVCSSNKLYSLNVAGLTSLTTLYCDDNQLSSLLLYSNTALQKLQCANNRLWDLSLASNQALAETTQFEIGDQHVTASAKIVNDKIYISHYFSDRSKIASTSLDKIVVDENAENEHVTISGYDGSSFIADEASNLVYNGKDNVIEYEYSVGNNNAENMSVFIDVERDFYQVNYFTNESKTHRMKFEYVNKGANATAPDITELPEGKVFVRWSENLNNVQNDMDVYVVWADYHVFVVSAFNDGMVTLYCTDCGKSETVLFEDMINSTPDDIEYVEAVDVVSDGRINAKDYAKLYNQFK